MKTCYEWIAPTFEESDDECNVVKMLQHKLNDWIVNNNIPQTAVHGLLEVLQPSLTSLLSDTRTTVGTNTKVKTSTTNGKQSCLLA